jgi:hypothetical protein
VLQVDININCHIPVCDSAVRAVLVLHPLRRARESTLGGRAQDKGTSTSISDFESQIIMTAGSAKLVTSQIHDGYPSPPGLTQTPSMPWRRVDRYNSTSPQTSISRKINNADLILLAKAASEEEQSLRSTLA